MEKKTVVLATYGTSRAHAHYDCMRALEHELKTLIIETRCSAHIDVARSQLVMLALDHGADVVVFIDHDIVFDPLDVERLAEQAREHQGIVGAPYCQRAVGKGVVCGIDQAAGEVVFFEGGGIYKATGIVGMGFTAIARSVFKKLDELSDYALVVSQEGLLRPYFQKLVVDGYWHKEDASFCHAARSAGFPTLIDTRIRVRHVGEYQFDVEDALRHSAPRPSVTVHTR